MTIKEIIKNFEGKSKDEIINFLISLKKEMERQKCQK